MKSNIETITIKDQNTIKKLNTNTVKITVPDDNDIAYVKNKSTVEFTKKNNDDDGYYLHNGYKIKCNYIKPVVASFEKVSRERFFNDMCENEYFASILRCVVDKFNSESEENTIKNIDPEEFLNMYLSIDNVEYVEGNINIPDNIVECMEKVLHYLYDNLKKPVRATVGSAGYDFFNPFGVDIKIMPDNYVVIPTGIRVLIAEGWHLQMHIRSGLSFKNRIRLVNGTGIIDEDYSQSDNEGHMFMKLENMNSISVDTFSSLFSNKSKEIIIKKDTAYCQGILLPYGLAEEDEVTAHRNGGFGSTTK